MKSYEKERPMAEESYRFPDGFVWGAATASYQVEGAAREGGRGPSIWDEFSHSPGRTHDGDTGDVACDQYHRYKEDVAVMKSYGLKAYRFSVAWPRVFPEGRGAPNEEGIRYYENLVDELLSAGIEPWVTLFHWDLPLALEKELGGWRSRGTAEAFGRYAAFVVKRLSDRVRNWFTVNEIRCFTLTGHRGGGHAPGVRLEGKAISNICHNALLAHGLAVRAIRENSRQEPNVGLAENPSVPVPVIETPEHVEAARKAIRATNAQFITTILEGAYPEEHLRGLGADGPDVEAGDLEVISSPLDFVGLNMYSPTYVMAADTPEGFRVLPFPRTYPTYNLDWMRFGPAIAYWGPRLAKEVWDVKAVYVTENGASCDDVPDADGEVHDTDRIVYIREHLVNAHRAVSEGWPLRGYFVWSYMDNFEWAQGFSKRLGLTYVDYRTQRRTPKLSAKWYAEVIRRGRVV